MFYKRGHLLAQQSTLTAIEQSKGKLKEGNKISV
jgi:hypothetical protein